MSNPRTIPNDEPGTYMAVFSSTPTSLPEEKSANEDVQKVIKDGHLYILRDGKTYTIQGAEVKAPL